MAISLLGLCFSFLIHSNILSEYIFSYGQMLAHFLGIYLLIMNGSILKTIYFKLIILFLLIASFGMMQKIMHSQTADMCLITGLLGIVITYTVRFFNKRNYTILDTLKLLWISCSFIISLLVFLHILNKQFGYLSMIIFWCMIVYFAVLEFSRKPSAN